MNPEYDPQNLSLVTAPDDRLLTTCEPVDFEQVTEQELRAAADKMIAIMRTDNGIGLAGNQAGLMRRMFVMHIPRRLRKFGSPCSRGPIVLINPEITGRSKEMVEAPEGCLSLPGVQTLVKRHAEVQVQYWTLGLPHPRIINASGLTARCIQHEIDHLDGVMIQG